MPNSSKPRSLRGGLIMTTPKYIGLGGLDRPGVPMKGRGHRPGELSLLYPDPSFELEKCDDRTTH